MYLNDVFTVPVDWPACRASRCRPGLDGDGLPLGLQLIGRAFDEETMLKGPPRSKRRQASPDAPQGINFFSPHVDIAGCDAEPSCAVLI